MQTLVNMASIYSGPCKRDDLTRGSQSRARTSCSRPLYQRLSGRLSASNARRRTSLERNASLSSDQLYLSIIASLVNTPHSSRLLPPAVHKRSRLIQLKVNRSINRSTHKSNNHCHHTHSQSPSYSSDLYSSSNFSP